MQKNEWGATRTRGVRTGVRFAFPPSASRAVGLLEAIISLGILSVAMTILAQLTLHGIDECRLARERGQGALVAQQLTEEILAHRDNLEAWDKQLREKYELDEDTAMYRLPNEGVGNFFWKWDIRPAEDLPGMTQVVVRVYWRMPRRKVLSQKCEIQTLVAMDASATRTVAEEEAQP